MSFIRLRYKAEGRLRTVVNTDDISRVDATAEGTSDVFLRGGQLLQVEESEAVIRKLIASGDAE